MTDQTCSPPEEPSFAEALAELDGIVAELESGQLELEDGLTRYERGVGLLRTLQAKLADAQQKVTMLMGELDDEGGTPEPGAQEPSSGESPSTVAEDIPF